MAHFFTYKRIVLAMAAVVSLVKGGRQVDSRHPTTVEDTVSAETTAFSETPSSAHLSTCLSGQSTVASIPLALLQEDGYSQSPVEA
jgi:hypothetical protein